MEGRNKNDVASVTEGLSEEDIPMLTGEIDESSTEIPTLTEENYTTWKDSMENFLKEKGFWDYVIGAKHQPEDTSSEEYEDWQKKKEEIISVFKEKCGARVLPYIDGLDNVKHIWSQLVIMFEFTYPTNTTLGTTQRSTVYTWCVPLYQAIVDGNRMTMSELLSKNEGAIRARLTTRGELPIHVAVQERKVKIAKELINMMSVDDLSREDKNGRIAIHIAVSEENKEIVEAMVEKDKKLVLSQSRFYGGKIPINIAAMAGNKGVVNYLYPITIDEGTRKQDHDDQLEKVRASILSSLIQGEFYDLALDLVQKYPYLVMIKHDGMIALETLADGKTAFKSSLPTTSFGNIAYYFIYSLLDVSVDAKNTWWHTSRDVENFFDPNGQNSRGPTDEPMFGPSKNLCLQLLESHFCMPFQNMLIQLVPGCKDIYEAKLKHFQALKLLKEIWRKMLFEVDKVKEVEEGIVSAMFIATKNGTVEFILECIKTYPQLLMLSSYSHDDATIFHCAIKHRQGKIFKLIHDLGPLKNDLALMKDDESGDFMSHLASKKPANTERLNQVPDAALQMQRDLIWIKEVEYIMKSNYHWIKDKNGQTPKAVFMAEHKELLEEGAKWLKDTSVQCMVVAALISTIMFAAMFTIPGIDSGRIITGQRGEANKYIHDKFSTVFVVSNVLALSSSVASLLMFLAIITSRVTAEDFLSTLPRKLVLAFSSLFISTVGMMISFVAAVLFMVPYQVRLWVFFPIVILAIIPISIYALVELPLFVQLVFNTSSLDVFGKRTK